MQAGGYQRAPPTTGDVLSRNAADQGTEAADQESLYRTLWLCSRPPGFAAAYETLKQGIQLLIDGLLQVVHYQETVLPNDDRNLAPIVGRDCLRIDCLLTNVANYL